MRYVNFVKMPTDLKEAISGALEIEFDNPNRPSWRLLAARLNETFSTQDTQIDFDGEFVRDVYRRRRRAKNQPKDEATDQARAQEDAIQRERRRLEQQETIRVLQQLQRSEAKRQQYIAAIERCLTPVEPSELIPLENRHTGMPVHRHVLVFSDWHVGQKTPIESTGGLYEQTTEITRWQIDRLLEAYRSIYDTESQGQRIPELMLLFLGDLVEGDSMRPAQLRQIDMAVTRQVVEAFSLIEYLIRQLLTIPGIERIRAHFVGGNHDRTTPRPGNGGLGETDYVDTYAWLLGAFSDRYFEDDPRIAIVNWDTFFGYDIFADKRFVFEHGASFRSSSSSYGGVPWYPISNAGLKYQDMLDGADVVVMGHYHKGAILPMGKGGWQVMNGALPATTHFVQSSFKSIRQPMQWLLDMHDEHGMVSSMPLYAVPESLENNNAWDLARDRLDRMWGVD